MFPDAMRDDLFRLESKRLCLRWLRASDAKDIAACDGPTNAGSGVASSLRLDPVEEAEQIVLQSRADNADGTGLALAIAKKRQESHPIGVISATLSETGAAEFGYMVLPGFRGRGFATEATRAFVDAIFALTGAREILAEAALENVASCRVLEKCGFAFLGTGRHESTGPGEPFNFKRFRLDRETWARRRTTALHTPMAQQKRDGFEAAAGAARARH